MRVGVIYVYKVRFGPVLLLDPRCTPLLANDLGRVITIPEGAPFLADSNEMLIDTYLVAYWREGQKSGNPSPVMEAVNTELDNTDLEPVIFRSVCSVHVTMYKFEFRKRTITCL